VECNSHKRSISPGVQAYWLCNSHTPDWTQILTQMTPSIPSLGSTHPYSHVCCRVRSVCVCDALPCRAVSCRVVSCRVVPCRAELCSVVQCSAVRCGAVRWSAGRCCAEVLPGVTPRDGAWSSMEIIMSAGVQGGGMFGGVTGPSVPMYIVCWDYGEDSGFSHP
jgi:hypothetical protein